METFLDRLKTVLDSPLPGEKAHRKMMSYKRPTADEALQNKGDVKRGAVAVNLFLRAGEWHTVFILRQSYKGVHSAQVSFPGGKIEDAETPAEAAVRETFEEVGAEPARSTILGSLSPLYIPPSNFLVYPFVTFLEEEPPWVAQEREVQKIFTPSVSSLLDEKIIQSRTIDLPHYNTQIEAPTFEIEGATVWGATAMIWREFWDVSQHLFLD